MTHRHIDENGYITVKNNPISRSGVFQYLGSSIGADEPDRVYNVYRPASEFEDPETRESFKHIPWVDDHDMLGPAEDGLLPPEEKGIHGITCDNITFKNGILTADVKIFSQKLADMIKAGKTALSLGYRCVYEKASGVFNGQAYDYIQRQLRGNHLASVDAARCDVAVLDSHMAYDHFDLGLDNGEKVMSEEAKAFDGAEIVALLKAMDAKISALDEDIKEMKAAKDAEPDAEKDKDCAVDDDDDGMDEDKEAEKEEKKAMDAAISSLTKEVSVLRKDAFKTVMQEVTKRDELAGKLASHIGVFDHTGMDTQEVAKYGIEKLGLPCADGMEAAVLAGFLHNRPAPSDFVVAFDAAHKGTDSFAEFLSTCH